MMRVFYLETLDSIKAMVGDHTYHANQGLPFVLQLLNHPLRGVLESV